MFLSLGRVSSFRPALSRIWVRCSHELAKHAQETSPKVHRARVNTLLFGADRLLLTPRADTLESYLMTKLSDAKFYNTYRSTAFMRAIRFCLERHLFNVALALHDRMLKEGFLAIHSLSLRITALKLVRKATDFRDITLPLKKLFEKQAYDVPAFVDLVHYLTDDKHAPGALVDDLAHAFVSTRQIKLNEYPDLVGLLASINMRSDRLDAAQTWLQVFEEVCGAQGVLPDVTPYSDIISTINDINPKSSDAIQDVLLRMKAAGVSPDTSVFNALMRVNLVEKRYQAAFALYNVLMEKRSDELMPNDVTYKTLFRAANVLSHPRLARKYKNPEEKIPPRKLFRDMLVCHSEKTKGRPSEPSTVISVSAFHLALRTFMGTGDYAATYVALHILSALGFQPNIQTYLIVFVNLVHRMKHERNLPHLAGSYRLVDFLTHLQPNEDPDLPTLLRRIRHHHLAPAPIDSTAIGIETVSHLLRLGEPTRSTANDIPDVPTLPRLPSPTRLDHRQRHPQAPSATMLIGTEDLVPDQRTFFSPLPLARIVHRALLGELFRKAVHRSMDWDWKGAVGPIVQETQQETVPEGFAEGLSSRTSEKERKTGGRKGEVLPFAAARMRRRRRGARGGREIAFDVES